MCAACCAVRWRATPSRGSCRSAGASRASTSTPCVSASRTAAPTSDPCLLTLLGGRGRLTTSTQHRGVRMMLNLAVAVVGGVLALSPIVGFQSGPAPTDLQKLQTVGSAAHLADGTLRLTSGDQFGVAGAAWTRTRPLVADGFRV